MGIPGSANPMLFGGAAAYQINQSLRFNSADSAYLNRTAGTPTDNKKWTWSAWAKISGASQALNFASSGSGTSMYFGLETSQGDNFIMQIAGTRVYKSTAIFRDTSAWYHIVFVFDSANGTQADRSILYINGVRQAATTASVTLNQTTGFNAASTAMNIGYSNAWTATSSDYFSGYLAEVNFIDGTALTPSSFGETDTITGAWIPKKYSGSYGTNGFYLKFESSGIGTDSSGNGNTWTANNFSTSGTGTDVMSDTPTNNWCTLNPLTKSASPTPSDGNLVIAFGGTYPANVLGSIGVSSGKWYWEVLFNGGNNTNGHACGVAVADWANLNLDPVSYSTPYNHYVDSRQYFSNNSVTTNNSTSFTDGDIIGVALNVDSNQVSFYKNGTIIGSAQSLESGQTWFPFHKNSSYTSLTQTANFGQRGAFAYTPPTGFKALNTANLPVPTIKKGGAHFNTVLYTGTGSTQSISGVGFQPDFVWIKKRSATENHELQDAVRGATKRLASNVTDAEVTVAGSISSFNTDGFTVVDAGTTNELNYTYVAWNWKANGAGSSNTAGTITSTVSANATAGFSIVTYTGNSTAGATIGHGLGVAPSMVIVKSRTYAATSWCVSHSGYPTTQTLYLDDTTGVLTRDRITARTASTFTVGSHFEVNDTGDTYVAYCFSEVAGYSKFGSYTGNGSSDGPFVFCGFKPRWLMIKRSDSTESWLMFDTARETYNPTDDVLWANLSNAESANYTPQDFTSNGFKIRTNSTSTNASGGTYIFAAFSETAFKYSNAR